MLERPLATLPVDRATRFLETVAPELAITDRNLYALGFQRVATAWQDAGGPAAFEPVALFGYRALDEGTGLAYAIAMLDTARGVDVHKTLALAIAHKAQLAGHARLVVVIRDRALATAFARLGVVFPAELQTGAYLVGTLARAPQVQAA